MLSLGVLFAVITVCQEVYSLPSQSADINVILKLAKKRDKEKDLYRDNEYNFEPLVQNINRYGSQESQEAIDLFQKSKQDKDVNDKENEQKDNIEADEILKKNYERNNDFENEDLLYNLKNSNDYSKDSRFAQEALEQLSSSNELNKKYYNKAKLVSNSLVRGNDFNTDRNKEKYNTDNYSKIFIILNPEEVAKSSSKKELKNLLKKIISLTTSSQKERRKHRSKERKYKGFSHKDRKTVAVRLE